LEGNIKLDLRSRECTELRYMLC